MAKMTFFSRGLRDSIGHCVGALVGWSIGWLVRRSASHLLFRRFASDFCITAPAQWQVTDAVV